MIQKENRFNSTGWVRFTDSEIQNILDPLLTVNRRERSDRGVINLTDCIEWIYFCITLALKAISLSQISWK